MDGESKGGRGVLNMKEWPKGYPMIYYMKRVRKVIKLFHQDRGGN